jgi:hypothetical protein
VTRVFSKEHGMFVYLEAYQQGVASTQPLVAVVTFYHGQNKTFETRPIEVQEALNNRLKTMPVQFDIRLDKLAPGRYDCQVSVLNPIGQKVAFWQAPILVVP